MTRAVSHKDGVAFYSVEKSCKEYFLKLHKNFCFSTHTAELFKGRMFGRKSYDMGRGI